ncbi:exonuclease domain-containing protein [Weissella ceti]|uniref:3'-5' exonuclease DinG n=1 Tax=Weissella ceti TaxID=759620 RepID=A0ABT3E507_9LACO|nr:helicase C-terminal domain-containing protein [Weissella ceti]MCW0953297.1 exonuclease domain-containing protein [Weissella ceti]QVK11404.1 DNA polymerase III subunit epsilon [Weissella ceti]
MLKQNIYAVVDLETTQTSLETGRIIQIAIAFVQNNKIINQYSTLINPGMVIPRHVVQLTGIDSAMVKSAPAFEDVAHMIHAMLQGTVFVAHNVNFDWPFLNAEFERVGLTPLTGQAIDTVTLSQMLYPTAPGYRLIDMAQYLGIDHLNPHKADSDAATTASLFMKLVERAQSLPMITLQTLVNLPLNLPKETRIIIEQALTYNQKEPKQLDKSLEVLDGLAIRRFSAPAPLVASTDVKYPKKPAALEQVLGDSFAYRKDQAKLMNFIEHHYAEDTFADSEPGENALVIEAPTGLGKTLGYSLPYAYLANQSNRKVVVAVPTLVQQQQVTNLVNQKLNPILPFETRAVSLKGRTHYVNLQSFRRALNVDEGSTGLQFTKAQILVWLTETLTGDFDELNLLNPPADFLQKLTQAANNPTGSAFYGHEFFERQLVVANEAQFLVINHAYLTTYAQELGKQDQTPFLVIDEPQHLPDAIIDQNRRQLDFTSWQYAVSQALDLVVRNEDSLQEILARIPAGNRLKHEFILQLKQLLTEIPQLEKKFYRRFLLNRKQVGATEGHLEVPLNVSELALFFIEQTNRMQKVKGNIQAIEDALDKLLTGFSELKNVFSVSERQALADFRRWLRVIKRDDLYLTDFQENIIEYPQASVFWLTLSKREDINYLKLSGGLLNTTDYFKDKIYPHFMPATLIGATLFTSTKSSYLYERLDLNRETAEVHQFDDVYDYEKQTQMLLVEDAVSPTDSRYPVYIAKQLEHIMNVTQENTLVLFNSLEMIEQVFHYMQQHQMPQKHGMTLLAQGVTGTKGRILKRMQSENKMIVLGANSFWEGVDLPNEQVRLVVITRLPFDAPNTIPQKAEESILKAAGKQPFYNSVLPKAVLRLRQGVGRLLRTEKDYGAIVILDSRIVQKTYGKTLRKMLPKKMPQLVVKGNDVSEHLQKFFTEHR